MTVLFCEGFYFLFHHHFHVYYYYYCCCCAPCIPASSSHTLSGAWHWVHSRTRFPLDGRSESLWGYGWYGRPGGPDDSDATG